MRTNGIMSNDGKEVSICSSTSDTCVKTVDSLPKTGDMARPGNDVRAETDQIPNNTIKEIVPLPVFIFMTFNYKTIAEYFLTTPKLLKFTYTSL